jgi:1-deoxy-D-xylulose-5-phosphate reductoisomerase
LAIKAGRRGGVVPAVYNAANEVCVAAFLAGHVPYLGIVDTVASVMAAADLTDDVPSKGGGLNVDDVLAADRWARDRASAMLEQQPTAGGAAHT